MHRSLFMPLSLVALIGSTSALALGACSNDDEKTASGGSGGSASNNTGGSATGGSNTGGKNGSGGSGGSTASGGGSGAGGGYSALPQAVKDAGYDHHTWSSTFTDKTVDTKLTKAAGFQWYPYDLFGSPTELDRIVIEDDDSVTLKGSTSGPNGEIATGVSTGNNTFTGTAFGGGAYFEATFSFDPATVIAHCYKGVPAWWSIPVDFLLQSNDTFWNGDKTGNFDHHIEPDFFEYNAQSKACVSKSPEIFGGTFHDWYGVRKVTCGPDVGECDWHSTTSINARSAPVGIDWKQDNAVGFLWIPATDSEKGSATFMVNGVPAGETIRWDKWQNTPQPTATDSDAMHQMTQPPWAISWMDREHYLLVLGTGEGEPMNVKRVEVWQKNEDGNLKGKGP